MSTEHLPSETLATPKTDAASVFADDAVGHTALFVPADFARAQERRIAELEGWLDRLLPSWRETEARDYEEAIITSQRREITKLTAENERLFQTAMARSDR